MRARRLVRAATVLLTGAAAWLVTALPALAEVHTVEDGESPAHTTWPYTVLVYVIAPLGAVAVMALLTYAPSLLRKPRYRPNRSWEHDAIWFNGPGKPDSALRTVRSTQVKGGGASASW